MLHHPAEVLEIIRPNDSDVKSADEDTLAVVKTWDDNVMTFVVDPKIAGEVKIGDRVLVDYRPIVVGTGEKPVVVPKQIVTKIVRGKKNETMTKEYKKYLEQQKQRTQSTPTQSGYIG